jgi:hypothetical protein
MVACYRLATVVWPAVWRTQSKPIANLLGKQGRDKLKHPRMRISMLMAA